MRSVVSLTDAPLELQTCIREFWPEENWEEAANVSFLESHWNPFAIADSRSTLLKCGDLVRTINGVAVFAEFSLGYFQINSCNFPDWDPYAFYNARHNCGTAHMLWAERGWSPWYFSAVALDLI